MASYWFVIVICGCILQAVFICLEYAKKFVAAVIMKGLASAVFVSLGIVCLSAAKDAGFGGLVIAGLVCGAVGDVLLNLPHIFKNAKEKIFMAGMVAFLIGHALYIAALMTRGINALLIAVPLSALLSAAMLPYTLKRIDVQGKLRTFGIVYIAVVLFMTCCAIGRFLLAPGNCGYLLFSIGAVLFTISDEILVFHLFGRKKHKALRSLNLSTYYFGQLLIALSLLFIYGAFKTSAVPSFRSLRSY